MAQDHLIRSASVRTWRRFTLVASLVVAVLLLIDGDLLLASMYATLGLVVLVEA